MGHTGLARFHDARELESRRIALDESAGVDAPGDEVLVATARRAGYEVRDWTYVRRDRTRRETVVDPAFIELREAALGAIA